MMPRWMECTPIGGEHGVSCVLPTMQDIVDFEEKSLRINRGYPRFVLHPYLQQLAGDLAFPVCSSGAARFIESRFSSIKNAIVEEGAGYALIRVSESEDFDRLMADTRNCGFTMSSRRAQAVLSDGIKEPGTEHLQSVIDKLTDLERGARADLVRLLPSGMAAIMALMMAVVRSPRSGITLVGAPYVDTRILMDRIPQHFTTGSFLSIPEAEMQEYRFGEKTGLVLLELPTNPLGNIADIEEVVDKAHRAGVAVAVDATIATPYNFHPFDWGVDIVIHSTTKFLNGKNDHLGGALMIRPDSSVGMGLVPYIDAFLEETECNMDPLEAAVLDVNLDGFVERMKTINAGALSVSQWLEAHPAVGRVWYPGLESHPDHHLAGRYLPKGSSGLLSFVLKESVYSNAALFYDNCTIPGKGPSLGGEETLLCPITMLTDYNATDAELLSLGQDRYTMRLSVGIESVEELINGLRAGLDRV